jgi:Asp-tRNA(Asn)/Glu-tRNA(Gln) amidotransferase A subunit family amidase
MEAQGFFDLPIGSILNEYKKGTLTPLDVANICIQQVEKYEPDYLAWDCFSSDILLEQAHTINSRMKNNVPIRSLEGIPVGIKDIINTYEFPTQMGSPLWKDFTPYNDARVVFYLKQAGAIIPGKTVTAEFAVHTLRKTLNPHDISRTPGTSSSGSAVATALGMVPVALGTQTAGSIVRPASFCGVYGCKPSFGLIPRTGILKTTDSLDTVGFFTLHCVDLERIFNVIRVHGSNYPISHAALTDKKRQNKPEKKPWRVAFVRTHLWEKAYPYARKALEHWIKRLAEEKDMYVADMELPESMLQSHRIHETIYNKTLSYYFKEEFKHQQLVSPIMKVLIVTGNSISVDQYQIAHKEQEGLQSNMDSFFKDFDILISLSTAGEAPPRNEIERPDPALMWSMTNLPVVSAPTFISPNGLPFGVQIVARRYNDPLLFKFCRTLNERGLIPDSTNPKVPVKPKGRSIPSI